MPDPGGEFERLAVTDRAGGVRISVRVRPKASRSGIGGVREGSLEVSVTAAPTDGAANSELCRVLARVLGVRQSSISIATGASSRNKVVEVGGMAAAQVRRLLEGAKR